MAAGKAVDRRGQELPLGPSLFADMVPPWH
jgi:hypothetical protein